VVEVCGLVQDFNRVREYEESVREALGDPKHLEFIVVGRRLKLQTNVASKVGRVAAEVDSNIPDAASEAADELALGTSELIVKAAKYSAAGEGLVILNEVAREAGASEGIAVEDL
jgi:hypothetical protein